MRCSWMIFIFVITITAGTSIADSDNIGNFDIEKVRKAAQQSDTLGETVSPAEERESITTLVLRVTLYLGVVIALIVGIAWVIRRNGLQSGRGSGSGAMDVIETLPIGQNRMLVMVRVMDEIYLLSQTASNISLLDKIGGQRALDIVASSKGGGTIINFKDAFNNFVGKIKKPS